MTLLVGERFARLVGAAGEAAQQQVLFDRDETDSYRIRLEAIHDERRQLSRAEVMPALPVGSRWADAVGWESYVLVPIPAGEGKAAVVVVGLEYVVEHPTRGAYAVFGGVVVPMASVRAVAHAIAESLDPSDGTPVPASWGVVVSDALSLTEHQVAAAWILRAGGAALAGGATRTVRTLLLTPDEVPRLGSLLSAKGIARGFLVGVVPPLRDRFSGWTNKLLGALQSKSFVSSGRSGNSR